MPKLTHLVIKFLLVAASAALIAAGCAIPTTIEDLQDPSAPAYSFRVDQDFEPIFKLVESRAQQCFDADFIGDDGKVQSRIDRTAGTAEVTYSAPEPIAGQLFILHAEIERAAPRVNDIRVAYYSPWKSTAWAVRRWVEEDYLLCSTHKPDSDGQGTAALTEEFSFSTRTDFLTTYGIITTGLRSCHDARLIRGNGGWTQSWSQKSVAEPLQLPISEVFLRQSTSRAQSCHRSQTAPMSHLPTYHRSGIQLWQRENGLSMDTAREWVEHGYNECAID